MFGDTTSTTPGKSANAAPPVTFIPAGQSILKIFRAVVSVTVWALTSWMSRRLFRLAQTANAVPLQRPPNPSMSSRPDGICQVK